MQWAKLLPPCTVPSTEHGQCTLDIESPPSLLGWCSLAGRAACVHSSFIGAACTCPKRFHPWRMCHLPSMMP